MKLDFRGYLAIVLACVLTAKAGAMEPRLAAATTIPLQPQTTGTYYIDGDLQGYGPLKLLVDTGSSFLVIDEAILNGLQLQGAATYSHDLEGVMADGSVAHIPLYRLAAIRLGEGCWITDVEAAVFPQATRPILGMNVLARLAPFTFRAEPPGLELQRCATAPTETLARGEGAAMPARPASSP